MTHQLTVALVRPLWWERLLRLSREVSVTCSCGWSDAGPVVTTPLIVSRHVSAVWL